MTRAALTFAGTTVDIGYGGRAAEDLIRFAWQPHLIDASGEGEPGMVLDALGPGRFCFTEPGRPASEFDESTALDALIERGTFLLARPASRGLLLHATVMRDTSGRALLCPGVSGAGKSVLALWLGRAGYGYVTDELAFVDEGTDAVSGLTRPLGFKRSGVTIAERCLGTGDVPGVRRSDAGIFVGADIVGPVPSIGPATIAALVFPTYQPDAPLELRPLTAGESALRLMSTLVNAPALERHGLSEAARLAKDVPAYELCGGDFEHAAATIAAGLR